MRKELTSKSWLMKEIERLQKILYRLLARTIHQEAVKYLGTDASAKDRVDDVVGCAESVTEILSKVLRFPIITGTWTLWRYLVKDYRFRIVTLPMPGDIIISPTGTGNGKVRGHVGIFTHNNVIMANDSRTGKWLTTYTLDTWKERYEKKGGMPVIIFSRKR